jgi:hypothetical protein
MRRTLALGVIEQHVAAFKDFAREHPEMIFQVTAIGCRLAGYKAEEIAPRFGDTPANCTPPVEFRLIAP